MNGFTSQFTVAWRIASPYFWSEEALVGRLLLGGLVAIELSLVGINVLLNQWNARFYNALQDRNWSTFVSEFIFFGVLAAAYIVVAVYQLYLNQWLQIRWRRWMTGNYLGKWLDRGNHYRMQLLGDAADNPDQRIAEDLQLFVERGLYLSLGLLNSVVTLVSFVTILWVLSAEAPFTAFGVDWSVPGYLVWAALIYSVAGTAITHLIGRKLIPLNFMQQRYEADFRFNLVRVRENSEQIALLHGDAAEKQRLGKRFALVAENWMRIMRRTKALTFFTAGFAQISTVFPFIVASPAYFSGTLQLGGLMQIASAFSSVQGALSFFASSNVYRQFAEWRAVLDRLSGFETAVETGRAAAVTQPKIDVARGEQDQIAFGDLAVRLPRGGPLLTADDVTVTPGERVLVSGPSGSGKSTLFRAISGIWPFGSGQIATPKQGPLMTLPQKPYFPIGTLAAAITYPAQEGSFDRVTLADAVRAVGLPQLAERLDEQGHWNQMLSLGEQQRLAVARALLEKPRFLLLDEATASLDEPAEAALYHTLRERLPATTIMSIGHRASLNALHDRTLVLEREDGTHRVREYALSPA